MSNVYLIYGNEGLLIDEWVDKAIKKYLSDGRNDINFSVINLDERTTEDFLSLVETVPFIGEYRVVVANNADFFVNNNHNHDLDKIYKYIANPAPYTKLVFRLNNDKIDKRKKITNYLIKEKAVFELNSLNDKELIIWLQRKAESLGVELSTNVAGKLIYKVGNKLSMLNQELSKLALYVKEGEISEETIEAIVVNSLEENIHLLADNIAKRNTDKGLEVLYDLLNNKEQPLVILMLLARKFRSLLIVKDFMDMAYSQAEITKILNRHPFYVKNLVLQAGNFNKTSLINIIKEIARADEQIKSSQLSGQLALERLIIKSKII